MSERKCIECDVPMKKAFAEYRGMKFEARQCPNCREKIFTEDLAINALRQMGSRQLEEEYIKKPMKIGNSWGMTFPKDMAEFFNLKDSKTRLKLYPHVSENKIEIVFGQ